MFPGPAAFDAALQGLVLLLVFATPLALGTVHVPVIAVFQWVVLVTFLVFILKTVWTPPAHAASPERNSSPGRRARWRLFGHEIVATGVGVPIGLFLLLVLFQMVPLPPPILRAISPATATLYEKSLPGYGTPEGVDFARAGSYLIGEGHDGVVQTILASPGRLPFTFGTKFSSLRSLSLYPFATASRLLVLLTHLALFFVAVNVFKSRLRIEATLRWIVLYGFALSIFGILQRLSWNGRIYWSLPIDPDASPFGPFINHNHFAAYVAMLVPVATGMLMDEARRLMPPRSEGGRASLLGLHGPEPFARMLLAAFVVAVMAGAVALSASRGAVLALAASFLLYGGALLVQGRVGRPEAAVAAILLIVAIGISLWLGIGPLAQKLRAIGDVETEPSLFSRIVGWRWTMKIVGDHPLLGTGLGTFSETWKHYYPPGTAAVWHEAHNDYLQLLSETGAVGCVIFAAAVAIFAWRYLLPGILRGHRSEPYLVHGIVVGIAAVSMHSVVDFPLQINACAVLFVVLAAMLVAYRKRAEAMS